MDGWMALRLVKDLMDKSVPTLSLLSPPFGERLLDTMTSEQVLPAFLVYFSSLESGFDDLFG